MLRLLVLLLAFAVTSVWAEGDSHYNTPPAVTASNMGRLLLPQPSDTHQPPPVLLTTWVYPGSLKNNVEKIARHNGWSHVVWNSAYDYNWVGKTQVHANNLPGLLDQILDGYPLQAEFYQGNHILEIKPRVLKS